MGTPEITRLDKLASLVDGSLVPTVVRHAIALAARDGEHLDQVATDFAAMGANLLAAEAAAQAASIHGAQGEKALMEASNSAARRHFDACEGVDPAVLPSLAALRTEHVVPAAG